MRVMPLRFLPILTLAVSAFAQTAAPRPEFEVASIRPSGPQPPNTLGIGLHIDGAQVNCSFLSLRDYIAMAWRLKYYQVSGPDWIANTRFDIAAKLPDGAKRDQVPEMLQALLEDRFHLKFHKEPKEFAVYALIPGKGTLKLKQSAAAPATEPSDPSRNSVNVTASGGRGGATISLGNGANFSFTENRVEASRLNMLQFVDLLGRFAEKPVLDMTQLNGTYDITMEFSPDDFRAMMIRSAIAAGVPLPPQALQLLNGATDEPLFNAVEALGLRLDRRKAPIDVIVIDKAEKAPTEN